MNNNVMAYIHLAKEKKYYKGKKVMHGNTHTHAHANAHTQERAHLRTHIHAHNHTNAATKRTENK